jgi:signal transduction histidine kinase
MAGTMLHDINNHLSVIRLTADSELRDPPAEPDRVEAWNEVMQVLVRVQALTEAVRRFARKTAAKRVPVDVHDVISDAFLLLGKLFMEKRVRVAREESAARSTVAGDQVELVQVLVNLVRNAVDAMEGGGRLEVRTRNESGAVMVDVTDEGCGIPAENLPRVFEAFFTTKPEDRGTGLGLAVCRRVVEAHGGTLGVRSVAGKGSTFTVTLPLLGPTTAEEHHLTLDPAPAR